MAAALVLGLTAFVAGCGGGGSGADPAPTLSSIAVTASASSLAAGLTSSLTAIGKYSDGSTQNITSSVTWSSSSTSVATVASTGVATALAAGSATITATSSGVSGTTSLTVTAAALVSIGVTPAKPTLAKGTTLQFVAMGTYTDNSVHTITADVTWTSSSTATATISMATGTQGLATAVAPGTTSVTATLGSVVSPAVTLTVTPAALVSIGVTPANPTIAKGMTQQFVAMGTYTDMSTQNLSTSVTWASSTPATATISDTGLATSVAPGTTSMTATLGGIVSPKVTLTVTPATLLSIAVTPANPNIAVGTTQQFVATGTYTDGTTPVITTAVTWASGTLTTATISNATGTQGLASGVGDGTTAITASLGTVTSPAVTLTVAPVTLISIAVTPGNPSIGVGPGDPQQFVATGTYNNGTQQIITTSVTWASGTTTTATISNAGGSQGLATGLAVGTTAITATDPVTGVVSPAVTLTVTPAVLTSIAVTPANPSILVSGTQQFVATGTKSDGTQSTITTTVTWASGTLTTATISNASGTNGLATGLAVGTTAITATDPTTGIVSPAQTLTVTAATQYAYAVNDDASGTVSQYAIEANGTLSPMSPATVPAGTNPYAIAVDPTGHYAYVANYGSANVWQYTIGTGGALSPMGTATVGAGNGPNGITVKGNYVYVPNYTDGTVSQYSIGAGGALQPLTPATVTVGVGAGTGPQTVYVNAAGTVAYVGTAGNGTIAATIAVYSITAGALSTTATSTVTLSVNANPVAIVSDPTGTYLYVSELGNGTIGEYQIGGGGALTALSPASYSQDATSLTLGTAGDSAGSIYATNWGTTTVVQLNVYSGGGTCTNGTASAGQLCYTSDLALASTNGPWALAFDQLGNYAYVADRGNPSYTGTTISQFSVNGAGGVAALTPATVPSGTQPTSIVTSLAY